MSAATTTRMSPLSAKVRSPRSTRDRGGTTPNYFNPLVSPATKASEPHTDFEAFRRQSESNSFSLGHGNLTYFSTGSGSRNASNEASPAGSRERATMVQSPSPQTAAMDEMENDTQKIDYMDVDPPTDSQPSSQTHALSSKKSSRSNTPASNESRNYSPPRTSTPDFSRSRRHYISAIDERHPRNSLPNNRLDPPPPSGTNRAVQRSETLPDSLSAEGPNLISPEDLCNVFESYSSEDVLLLDVRVYPQYSQSRIDGALNLCIPTTLLKRPAFNVQKLEETFTKEIEKAKFAHWREAKVIVVYDAASSLLKDATSSINTLKKFTNEGWRGLSCIVRGGFLSFSRKSPDLIDRRPANEMEATQGRKLSIDPQKPLVAPVAGGCIMPSNQSAANPFFGSIRQNMDLIGGVGQIPLNIPQHLRTTGNKYLPPWLKAVSDERNTGKTVADRFLQIEKGEQQRMQKALSGTVHYGSPTQMSPNSVRIAGIEKGTKNRYKDMLPYDHTRVRLQNVPAGECDYINASHIRSSTCNRHYIASQAPVPATIEDFWRVVWEQEVYVLVMLTAEHDGGQRKSHPYWDGTYGTYQASVTQEYSQPLNATVPRTPNNTINTNTNTQVPSILIREITLTRFGQTRSITQLHYCSWPDFGVPTDPAHLLAIVRICRDHVRQHGQAIDDKDAYDALPIVVHCSAGCGRTGTFCTVDSVVATLEARMQERFPSITGFEGDESTEDLVAKTVEDFRLQRLSMVQTLRQFVLCYETVLEWFDKGLREVVPSERETERPKQPVIGGEEREGLRPGVEKRKSYGAKSPGQYFAMR